MKINLRLKEIREGRGISSKEMAEYLQISEKLYLKYENGEKLLPVKFLVYISNYYLISTDYIIGRSDNPERKI